MFTSLFIALGILFVGIIVATLLYRLVDRFCDAGEWVSYFVVVFFGVVALSTFRTGKLYGFTIPTKLAATAAELQEMQTTVNKMTADEKAVLSYRIEQHNQECYEWAEFVDSHTYLFHTDDLPDVSVYLVGTLVGH